MVAAATAYANRDARGCLTPELSCGRVKQKRARSARNIHSVARQLQRTLDRRSAELAGNTTEMLLVVLNAGSHCLESLLDIV